MHDDHLGLVEPTFFHTLKITVNITVLTVAVFRGTYIWLPIGISVLSLFKINYGIGNEVSLETIADIEEPLKVKWYNDSFIKIPIRRD